MTPFQEFRLWSRRAPMGQRVTAAVAAVVALSALGWMLVPAGAQTASNSGSPGSQAQSGASGAGASGSGAGASATATTQTVAGGAQGATGGPTGGPGGAAGGAAGAAASRTGATGGATASSHCTSPPGSAQGVTSTQINIAVLLVNIAGAAGNQTFGVASPQQQQTADQAVIDNINASGGVACRKLAPQFFTGNPVDSNSLQQACLAVAQAGVFAVIDLGAFANFPNVSCFAQNHIPYFGGNNFAASLVNQFYPYIFDFGTLDAVYKDTVFGLQKDGFFSPTNGFKKLGIIYRDCYPKIFSEETGWLSQAGVAPSNIVTYDVGCPSALASPSDIENAVLKFQQAGVTNVTTIDELGDFAAFTNVAQAQNFHPKYGLADDGLLEIAGGAEAPNSSNVVGAIAVTSGREGEQNTAGLTPTAGTARCNAIMQPTGLGPVYQQPGGMGGDVCDLFWMFAAATDHAPAIAQNALANGLEASGSVDFSFPEGPNNFAGTGVTVGGQFYRFDQFSGACKCWQVIQPNFQPSF